MNCNKLVSEHELLHGAQIGIRLSRLWSPPLFLLMICPAWFGVKGMRVGVRILGKVKLVYRKRSLVDWRFFADRALCRTNVQPVPRIFYKQNK